MWYFTWILGLGVALAFGVINVLWLESAYAFGALDEATTHERFTSWSGVARVPAAPVAD
jgi:cyd operon protein YbgT